LPWPVAELAHLALMRHLLSWLARFLDPQRKSALGRYAQILETSFNKTQRQVFELV
jgi:hypothetical protein